MQLKLFKTLWGHRGSYAEAIQQTLAAGFQGIEGPAPEDDATRQNLYQLLRNNGLLYIAEITTAGSYVPARHATLEAHLDSLARKLEQSMPLNPLFISCLGGCDAWPEAQSIEFFGHAMELADSHEITVSFETHRSRSFFNPWVTLRIARQLPALRLTCDFSHWCVVCERLLDTEIDVIRQLAPHAHHIHGRVGYDQGPQVPHPAAPEYAEALQAHQGWWEILWQSQRERAYPFATLTPEFGPDGYLHTLPFTQAPIADLWAINQWMGQAERQHFADFNQDGY